MCQMGICLFPKAQNDMGWRMNVMEWNNIANSHTIICDNMLQNVHASSTVSHIGQQRSGDTKMLNISEKNVILKEVKNQVDLSNGVPWKVAKKC